MKNLLLALFLAGCTVSGTSKPLDAGVSVHFENQYRYTHDKYYPVCLRQCGSEWDDCINKCDKDFAQIKKVLERAIRDHREDDFYEMMDSWYGQN